MTNTEDANNTIFKTVNYSIAVFFKGSVTSIIISLVFIGIVEFGMEMALLTAVTMSSITLTAFCGESSLMYLYAAFRCCRERFVHTIW